MFFKKKYCIEDTTLQIYAISTIFTVDPLINHLCYMRFFYDQICIIFFFFQWHVYVCFILCICQCRNGFHFIYVTIPDVLVHTLRYYTLNGNSSKLCSHCLLFCWLLLLFFNQIDNFCVFVPSKAANFPSITFISFYTLNRTWLFGRSWPTPHSWHRCNSGWSIFDRTTDHRWVVLRSLPSHRQLSNDVFADSCKIRLFSKTFVHLGL